LRKAFVRGRAASRAGQTGHNSSNHFHRLALWLRQRACASVALTSPVALAEAQTRTTTQRVVPSRVPQLPDQTAAPAKPHRATGSEGAKATRWACASANVSPGALEEARIREPNNRNAPPRASRSSEVAATPGGALRERSRAAAARSLSKGKSISAIAAVAATGVCGLLPGVATAGECPNEARREEDPYSTALPDCRAYEQVSPVEKNLSDTWGTNESIRVAPSGEAVTFNSLGAFSGSPGALSHIFEYLSMRGAQGWSTQALQTPSSPAGGSGSPLGVTEDLEQAFITSHNEPPLSPEGVEGVEDVYLRSSATGDYRLLSPVESFDFVGATDDDSRIIFESTERLLPEAPPEVKEIGGNVGVYDLYEWHDGSLKLLDVLPDGDASLKGAAAGPLDTERSHYYRGGGGAEGRLLVKGAVSEDGSHVFFTDAETDRLYVREPQARAPPCGVPRRRMVRRSSTAKAAISTASMCRAKRAKRSQAAMLVYSG
jgi:hypothetical protein